MAPASDSITDLMRSLNCKADEGLDTDQLAAPMPNSTVASTVAPADG